MLALSLVGKPPAVVLLCLILGLVLSAVWCNIRKWQQSFEWLKITAMSTPEVRKSIYLLAFSWFQGQNLANIYWLLGLLSKVTRDSFGAFSDFVFRLHGSLQAKLSPWPLLSHLSLEISEAGLWVSPSLWETRAQSPVLAVASHFPADVSAISRDTHWLGGNRDREIWSGEVVNHTGFAIFPKQKYLTRVIWISLMSFGGVCGPSEIGHMLF